MRYLQKACIWFDWALLSVIEGLNERFIYKALIEKLGFACTIVFQ